MPSKDGRGGGGLRRDSTSGRMASAIERGSGSNRVVDRSASATSSPVPPARDSEERDPVLDALVDHVRRVVQVRRDDREPTGFPEIGPSLALVERAEERQGREPRARRDRSSRWPVRRADRRLPTEERHLQAGNRSGPRRLSASAKIRTPLRSSSRPKNTNSVSSASRSSGASGLAATSTVWPSVKYGMIR